MKTFWVNGLNKMGIESGTYVLASEAEAEIAKAKSDWLERCTKFRKQDADAAAERERVLVVALEEILNHVNENSRIGVVIRAALAQVKEE